MLSLNSPSEENQGVKRWLNKPSKTGIFSFFKKMRCLNSFNHVYLSAAVKPCSDLSVIDRRNIPTHLFCCNRANVFHGQQDCTFFQQQAFPFRENYKLMLDTTGCLALRYSRVVNERKLLSTFYNITLPKSGNHMPSSEEMRLPFTWKNEMYEILVSKFYANYGTDLGPPTMVIFLAVQTPQCKQIKIRKTSRILLRVPCDHFRSSFSLCPEWTTGTTALVLKKSAHIEIVER